MDRKIEKSKYAWMKKAGLGAAGAAALVLSYVFLVPEGGRSLKVTGERLVVSQVERGEFEDFIPVRGQVEPLRTVYLDAIEGGRVEKVFVEDGALVEAGDVLVEISNVSLQLDVISREAQVTEQINNLSNLELQLEQNRLRHKSNLVDIDYQIVRLKRDLERKKELAAKGHISQADLDQVQDEYTYYNRRRDVTLDAQSTDERLQKSQQKMLDESVTMLRKNLEFARSNLEGLNIKAPVAGKLTALNAEIGQSLSRGERLGQIDDPARYKVSAQIDEFYLGRLQVGQTAVFNDFNLRVAKTYPQVTNGQFEVDLVFEGGQPTNIRRGQTLQMRLNLGDPTPALLIPYGAFYQDTGGSWIFVVTPDGNKAVKRRIRLGRRNARFIEVLDGLEQGEKVITSPYTSFVDMDRLELES